ncbi:ubiquitin-conjugating enzyme [Ophiostoma piceae UAMH 11346]|uniref:Ubiquitin-conjugating enzyme n=1 Tax=Ophiostoma piceae (strain UAMH 11346) TaxID=1262450 RepID=S3C0P0_OPHP1|nr:ubiquitin-conjugating enzyme [Ophiostoma piceae UAMH 11346]
MAARTATRRLLRELDTWQAEQEELAASRAKVQADVDTDDSDGEKTVINSAKRDALEQNNPNRGIERLGPVADAEDLFKWEAVLNGRDVGGGYDYGRWRLEITIPTAYPNQPPVIRFATPIMHANVSLATGAVCLDLLQSAWTPALTVVSCVRAVRMLLSTPGTDSPLNIDLAALLRAGDSVGAARLVQLWCEEEHYDGE